MELVLAARIVSLVWSLFITGYSPPQISRSEYLVLYSGAQGGSHERRLLNDLMNSYQKLGKEAKY